MENIYTLEDEITKQYCERNRIDIVDLTRYEKQDIDALHGLVSCDTLCHAKCEPLTYDEMQATIIHWKDHSYLSGCSHGC